MFPYKLIRSQRKSITIRITEEGTVEVRAPLRIRVSYLEQVLSTKENWVLETLAKRQSQNEEKKDFSVEYGKLYWFRGKEYPLFPNHKNAVYFDYTAFYIPGRLELQARKQVLILLYKDLAKQYLLSRVSLYSKQMGLIPSAVKINSAKTRWGSCSSKKSINFSWRLILAEDEVIDYVVVHELAHLKEMNHSQRFWSLVESVFPDYERRKQGLESLQERLSKEDWNYTQ